MKNTYSFLKFIIFSILTLGIYSIVKCTAIGDDVSRLDGKQTIPAWVVALFLGPITFGIFPLIWWHNICSRIGNLHPSNNFSALTFWVGIFLASFCLDLVLLYFFLSYVMR